MALAAAKVSTSSEEGGRRTFSALDAITNLNGHGQPPLSLLR